MDLCPLLKGLFRFEVCDYEVGGRSSSSAVTIVP